MDYLRNENFWEMLKRDFAAVEKSLKSIQNALPNLTPALNAIKGADPNQLQAALGAFNPAQAAEALNQLIEASEELNKYADSLRKQLEQLRKFWEQQGNQPH